VFREAATLFFALLVSVACPIVRSAPSLPAHDNNGRAVAVSSAAITVFEMGLDHRRCCDNPGQYVLSTADGDALKALAAGSDRQVVGFEQSGEPIVEDRLHLLLDGEMQPGRPYMLSFGSLATEVRYDPVAVTGAIQVNQVGYAPLSKKYAYAGSWLGTAGGMPINAKTFEVVDASGVVVFSGPLKLRAANDPWSGNNVYEADFSKLEIPGKYRLRIRGLGSSDVFSIAADVYRPVARTVLRLLYHSRNGIPITAPWADPGYERLRGGVPQRYDGVFHERVGHAPLGRGESPNEYHRVTRGWFDAGDYGQYIPNAAPVWYVAGLAFDLAPGNFPDGQLGIPESGNGIPDLLDELEWGMDWALSMQDDDGGVYFRIASRRWDTALPHDIRAPRLIGEKTTHATAVFAAMAAIHARLIAPYRPRRAKRVIGAAEAAWVFATTRPQWPAEGERYRNAPGISAGEYADSSARDGLLWAAAELFRTTGNPIYHREYEQRLPSVHLDPTGVVSFREQAMAAVWAYLMSNGAGRDHDALEAARAAVIAGADWRIRQARVHPFRAAMHSEIRLTGWGNFAHSMRASLSLLQAFYLTGKERYRQWAWLMPAPQLGANPQGLSYITGVGERSPRRPLSKLSMYDRKREPLNGIPVNGPHFNLPNVWPSTRAVNAAYLPAAGGSTAAGYPALRRYTDSDLLPPMSEPTVAEVATVGVAYGLLSGSMERF